MKGEYGQECNITACQKPNSAFWYNHFNHQYYCESCAHRLNNDIFNKRSALEDLGHDMCTYYPPSQQTNGKSDLGTLVNNIIKDDLERLNEVKLDYFEYKSGRENRRERRKQERKK